MFESILSLIVTLILPSAFIFAFSDDNWIFSIETYSILLIILIISKVIDWFKTVYIIEKDKIVMNSGVFTSKSKQILLRNVQMFDYSEPVIYRVFNLVKVKIDTGNVTEGEMEIEVVIKKKHCEEFREMIFGVSDNLNKKEQYILDDDPNSMKINNKILMLFSLSSFKIDKNIFILILLFQKLHSSMFRYIDFDNKILMDWIFKIFNAEHLGVAGYGQMSSFFANIIMLLAYLLLTILSMGIFKFQKYHKFLVYRNKEFLNIHFGMFEKKNYQISVKKITAVYLNQTLIQTLLGYYSICIESVGYGSEKDEVNMLYPLVHKNDIEDVLNKLLPEYNFRGDIEYAHKSTCIRFICGKLMLFGGIALGLGLVVKLFKVDTQIIVIIVGLITLFGICIGYLEYKHSAIGINSKLLYLSIKGHGRRIIIIPINKIQTYSIQQNYFQENKSIFDYEISIQSGMLQSRYIVKNIDFKMEDALSILKTTS